MITLTTTVQQPVDVISTTLHDEEMVLLHLQTQRYYTLNATGTHIWRGLQEGLSIAEVSCRLEAAYAVTLPEAQQATLALVQELAVEALVQPVGQ